MIKCDSCENRVEIDLMPRLILEQYKENLKNYDEHLCEGCIDNQNELAHEAKVESFYGGSQPTFNEKRFLKTKGK